MLPRAVSLSRCLLYFHRNREDRESMRYEVTPFLWSMHLPLIGQCRCLSLRVRMGSKGEGESLTNLVLH